MRCGACAADRAALGRLWRAENVERVAEWNAARRVAYREAQRLKEGG